MRRRNCAQAEGGAKRRGKTAVSPERPHPNGNGGVREHGRAGPREHHGRAVVSRGPPHTLADMPVQEQNDMLIITESIC